MGSSAAPILLVEDEEALREAFQSLLEIEGFSVLGAGDGGEALKMLDRCGGAVALILLDLQMPVVGGLEVRRRQLEDPRLARIPVIAYSGDFSTLAEIRELGVSACLRKPVDAEHLLMSVRALHPDGARRVASVAATPRFGPHRAHARSPRRSETA